MAISTSQDTVSVFSWTVSQKRSKIRINQYLQFEILCDQTGQLLDGPIAVFQLSTSPRISDPSLEHHRDKA